MDLTQAFYDRLAGDATLTALLSTYEGSPAIFTDDRVPGGADGPVLPYIVTSGNVAGEPDDTKTSRGEAITRDVYVFADRNRTSDVEAIAWRVKELFHRHPLVIDDWATLVATAHGPMSMSAEHYQARIVTVRLRVVEVA